MHSTAYKTDERKQMITLARGANDTIVNATKLSKYLVLVQLEVRYPTQIGVLDYSANYLLLCSALSRQLLT